MLTTAIERVMEMDVIRSYIIAGLAGSALLCAIAGTVRLPQLLVAMLLLLLGLALTVLGAVSLKNRNTLNLQGRVLTGIAELHLQSSADTAARHIEKVLQRIFPRAQLCLYPPGGDNSSPIMSWEPASRLVQQSLEEGRCLFVGPQQSGPGLPTGVANLALMPLGTRSYQALFILNVPSQTGQRNLQLVLDTLYSHLAVRLKQLEVQQQEQRRCEDLLGAAAAAMESHDPVFAGHARRVAAISRLIGQGLGMDEEELQQLVWAALLHDMGRWMAPQEGEPPELDHASRGARVIPPTASLAAIQSAVCSHHERYDGGGYPRALRHTEIPLAARIIAVADIYDALTRLGPEEERYEHQAALEVVKKSIGTQLDPLVVVALEEAAAKLEDGCFDNLEVREEAPPTT